MEIVPWVRYIRLGAVVCALVGSVSGCGEDSAAPATPGPAAPALLPPETRPEAVVPGEIRAWLDANVHPFDGAHLSLPHTDIEFLRDLVGDARVVALGEATHGTRDFFEMKARILRFLVEEMGFNTFAIEASWPEAMRLDRYVRTGDGDSAVLLSGLYFWTWRTESVLEMIEWMRAHNEAGGNIGFHGIDMQLPRMALHIVREFIRFVDPARVDEVASRLDCLARHANQPDRLLPPVSYRDLTDAERAECGAALEEVGALLEANRARYELAGGVNTAAVAERSLRIAYQYHLAEVGRSEGGRAQGAALREGFMAENTLWLNDRIGPEGRMVLWAHNLHVATKPGRQGHYQREALGDDMVVIGFSHEGGRFTAGDLSRSPFMQRVFDLPPPVENSFEAILAGASPPRFVLDLRRTADEPGSEWLFEPRLFRNIGCCFHPDWSTRSVFSLSPLPDWFDAIIHFESTRPTVLLPSRLPSTW